MDLSYTWLRCGWYARDISGDNGSAVRWESSDADSGVKANLSREGCGE